MDLWIAHRGAVTIVLRNLFSRDSIETIFRHPLSIVATDAVHVDGLPHPRLYGSYPRVLGLFVRERGWATVGDAIARMTGFPASRFALAGRGRIEAGAAADIVVFDPERIRDNTEYLRPREAPSGIHLVLANGVPAGSPGAGRLIGPGAEVSA
jgi:N-acyl-D-aspartate/D-glutamate deacylase